MKLQREYGLFGAWTTVDYASIYLATTIRCLDARCYQDKQRLTSSFSDCVVFGKHGVSVAALGGRRSREYHTSKGCLKHNPEHVPELDAAIRPCRPAARRR